MGDIRWLDGSEVKKHTEKRKSSYVAISIGELNDIILKNSLKPKKDRKRRNEIARVGCELLCLSEEDILFILNDKNDIFDVEQLFRKRKRAV